MNSFLVFLRKEFTEFNKTYKFLILIACFTGSAVMSAGLAWLVPKIMESTQLTSQIPEAAMIFGKATLQSAFYYFINDHIQIGAFVMIFLSAGAVCSEISKGTATLILTKNITREAFVLSKFVVYTIWYTIAFVFALGCFIGTTQLLIGESVNKYVPLAMTVFWLYGVLLIAASIFASCVMKKYISSALIGLSFYFVFYLLSVVPKIASKTPSFLISAPVEILNGGFDMSKLIIPVIITIVLIVGLLTAGILVFKKQEI